MIKILIGIAVLAAAVACTARHTVKAAYRTFRQSRGYTEMA